MGRGRYMKNHSYIRTPIRTRQHLASGPRVAAAEPSYQGCQAKPGSPAKRTVGNRLVFPEHPARGRNCFPALLRNIRRGRSQTEPATGKVFSPGYGGLFRPARPAGFSLLECLISLGLSLLILLSALEVSAQVRRIFLRLSEAQERSLAVSVALEKIREDLETAGAGIPGRSEDTGFAPLQVNNQVLVIFSAQRKTGLLADISAGQDFLLVELQPGLSSVLKKGRAVYLTDGSSGRVVYINSVSGNRLNVTPALDIALEANRTQVIILEKIELYLDGKQKVLRRRVNNTSGQPLVEGVEDFAAAYLPAGNLVSINLSAESGGKSHEYELLMYPRNLSRL